MNETKEAPLGLCEENCQKIIDQYKEQLKEA